MFIWDHPRNWKNYFDKSIPNNFTYIETFINEPIEDIEHEDKQWKNLSGNFKNIIEENNISYDLWCVTQDNPRGFRVADCYYIEGQWNHMYMGKSIPLDKAIVPTHYVKAIEGLN